MGVLPRALEIGRQLEFRVGQVVLVLNKPLELGEPFERVLQRFVRGELPPHSALSTAFLWSGCWF